MQSRFLIQLFLVVIVSLVGAGALTCRCDEGPDCKSGTCDAVKMWHAPEHCQTFYDANANGGQSRGGCSLTNFHCDIVSQTEAVEATFKQGKLSSFGGCCGEERCNENAMESILAGVKNASCGVLSTGSSSLAQAPPTSSFSCHCTPDDMIALFDLSVDRGVQWLPSATNSSANNASAAFDSSASLRQRMSTFCTNNMCNLDAMASAGISAPSNAFGVCANYLNADTGKAVRGCTFVPSNPPPQESANDYMQSRFPPTPIAGTYDVRVSVNMSERYPVIFECRSDNCNDQQFQDNVLQQCLPGVHSSSAPAATNGQAGGSVNPLGVPFPAEVPSGTNSNATGSVQPGMGGQPPEVPSPDSTLMPGGGVEGVMPPLPPFVESNATAPGTPFGVGAPESPFTSTGNESVAEVPATGGSNASNVAGTVPESIPETPLSPAVESNNTGAGFEPGVMVTTTAPGGIMPGMQPGEGNVSAPGAQPGMGNTNESVSGIPMPPPEGNGTETNVPFEPVAASPNNGNATAESPFIPVVPEENGTVPAGGVETAPGIVPEMPMEPAGNGTETNAPQPGAGNNTSEAIPEVPIGGGNANETNVPMEPVAASPTSNGTAPGPESNGTVPVGGVETAPGIVPETHTTTILERPGNVEGTTAQAGGNETASTTVATMEGAAGNATGNGTSSGTGHPKGAPSTGGAATARMLNIISFAPIFLLLIFH